MDNSQKRSFLKDLMTNLEECMGMADGKGREKKLDEISFLLLTAKGISTLDLLKFVLEIYTFGDGGVFAKSLLEKMKSSPSSFHYWRDDIEWLDEVVKKKERREVIEYLTPLIRSSPCYTEDDQAQPNPKSMTT